MRHLHFAVFALLMLKYFWLFNRCGQRVSWTSTHDFHGCLGLRFCGRPLTISDTTGCRLSLWCMNSSIVSCHGFMRLLSISCALSFLFLLYISASLTPWSLVTDWLAWVESLTKKMKNAGVKWLFLSSWSRKTFSACFRLRNLHCFEFWY